MTARNTAAPIEIGSRIGFFEVIELGPMRVKCRCQCGAVVTRDRGALRTAQITAAVPKCKSCQRAERHRKSTMFRRNPDFQKGAL